MRRTTAAATIELAARILSDGDDPGIDELAGHAGTAYAIAGLLRALPIHAARGQLYLPADVMARYGAQPADVFAARATTELRAVLAELRLRARRHLAAARELLPAAPAAVAPALLPVAVVRPALERMERRGYQPFSPSRPAAMAPAMGALARGALRAAHGVLNYSAAIRAPSSHCSRSASARAQSARFLAMVLALPRRRLPSGCLLGTCASGGNSPKLTFIG